MLIFGVRHNEICVAFFDDSAISHVYPALSMTISLGTKILVVTRTFGKSKLVTLSTTSSPSELRQVIFGDWPPVYLALQLMLTMCCWRCSHRWTSIKFIDLTLTSQIRSPAKTYTTLESQLSIGQSVGFGNSCYSRSGR